MIKEKPRIVAFDLETLPNLRAALENWPGLSNYPGLTLRASLNSIICFGFKVIGETEAKCVSAWDFPLSWNKDVNNDYALVKFAYETLKDADVIVTQNGKKFDLPVLNTRLLIHGLPTLPKIQHIDTKRLAKSNLSFFSNSLKHLTKTLTETEKMENEGWELWVKVWDRNIEAMKKMSAYCTQDVEALSQLFERLRPFAREMPNYNLFRRDGVEACHQCGSFQIQNRGTYPAQSKIWKRLFCNDCRTWSRVEFEDKEMRRSLKGKTQPL